MMLKGRIEGVDLEIENGRVIRATIKPFAYNGLPTLNISGAIGETNNDYLLCLHHPRSLKLLIVLVVDYGTRN